MAEVTRVNGIGHVHATLYSVKQLKAFLIDCGATLATGQDGIGGAIEALSREIGSTASMWNSTGTAGNVHVVMDGHAVDAETLQARVRHLGTVNGYDFSAATVTEGTAITVS